MGVAHLHDFFCNHYTFDPLVWSVYASLGYYSFHGDKIGGFCPSITMLVLLISS